jgi:hypothetical protein
VPMGIASESAEVDRQRTMAAGIFAMTVSGMRCYYCAQQITERRAVFWDGATGKPLFLHGGCALNFIVRITTDVHRLQILESTRAELVPGAHRPPRTTA